MALGWVCDQKDVFVCMLQHTLLRPHLAGLCRFLKGSPVSCVTEQTLPTARVCVCSVTSVVSHSLRPHGL